MAKGKFLPIDIEKHLADFQSGRCSMCGKQFKNRNGVARHIQWFHKITLEETFILFGGKQQKCGSCGKAARFDGTMMRYLDNCGNRSCSAKLFRVRADTLEYRNNISKAMKSVWEDRAESGEDILIRQKITNTIIENNKNMTQQERNKKFGWMNNPDVSPEKKRQVWENSLGKFYASITDNEYQAIRNKAFNTLTQRMCEKFPDVRSSDVIMTEEIYNNLISFFNIGESEYVS